MYLSANILDRRYMYDQSTA